MVAEVDVCRGPGVDNAREGAIGIAGVLAHVLLGFA